MKSPVFTVFLLTLCALSSSMSLYVILLWELSLQWIFPFGYKLVNGGMVDTTEFSVEETNNSQEGSNQQLNFIQGKNLMDDNLQ